MCRIGFDNRGDTLLVGQVRGGDEDESESDDKTSMVIFRSLATRYDDHGAFRRVCRKLWLYDEFSNL
jgi:hypothetical protein